MKKFHKFFLIGLSIIFLIIASLSISGVNSIYQKGPKLASAAETWEGPGCDGANSVWGEWSVDGGTLLRVEQDFGNRGECGVPIPTITQTVQEQTWEGPGCDGSRSVWGVWSADGSRLINTEVDYGIKPGECGNPFLQPTPFPTPQSVQIVRYFDSTERDDRRSRSVPRSITRIDDRDRTIINDNSVSGSFNDSHNISGSYNDSHDRVTNPTRVIEREVVRVRDVPTLRYTDTEVVCPQGTTKMIYGDSITCQAPVTQQIVYQQPQVVTAQQPVVYVQPGSQQPQVVATSGADVKELPKTGLPLAALALGGLAPLGLRLRKFGGARSERNTSLANYIWEQRQFDAN